MMMFRDVRAKYQKDAFSERDKGARFERLMQGWMQTVPFYAGLFTHVWLWNEFPFRDQFGGKDIGIDLVALDGDGGYWAVQCKFFSDEAYIDKPAVDSFLATSSKLFQDESGTNVTFAHRLWISTTNRWGSEAEHAIQRQNPPVHRVSLTDLQESPVEWDLLVEGKVGAKARQEKKRLRPHQKTALAAAHEHFQHADRGKLIMACGTGKTYTALKIAEQETDGKGLVLFLVPSIALLGQTLREWCAEADKAIHAVCICSDAEVSRKKTKLEDSDGYTVEDLALPASTNAAGIRAQFTARAMRERVGMAVVFSTYQSIEVIAEVQKKLGAAYTFDLIVCDEAHRTTGVTVADEDESAFVKVHDNAFLKARKRLYMTATPRLYSDDSKQRAKEVDAVLCSMDDPALYGGEFHRIGFGEAVARDLLSDYKVLVLTMRDDQIPESLQKAIADPAKEINTDDVTKLIGCINALSKRLLRDSDLLKATDPEPMRRAVAFCPSIKASKKITDMFTAHARDYYSSLSAKERTEVVEISADHVDGTMGASLRDEKLSWLKAVPPAGNECRILTNVRCLSEGVDVPSLDAVLFISAKNSQIDVVQSVGRVMRRAPGKRYGYIVIPVVVPANVTPEEALADNERFKVVWTVLNALRAHDDRFNAMVNKIELNKQKPDNVIIGTVPDGYDHDGGAPKSDKKKDSKTDRAQLLLQFEQLQGVIYARMVVKVGDRRYWENWAKDVADIATRHITRITRLVAEEGKHQAAFVEFMKGLHENINPGVKESEAVEMLAQHLITRPVFEALFENYSFAKNNPVSVSMQKMLTLLDEQALDKDAEILERFYTSVRERAADIDNAEGKQRVIIELYDKFFKTAFPKVVEKLGIVYTPVEVVDFILHSVEAVLKTEFGRSLSDPNIHVLDPFTGTGTFLVRLLQSGLVKPKDLERKYREELHANEIVLLAYYIAAINIENAFHDAAPDKPFLPFEGICLTDTFQLGENDDTLMAKMFPENSERITAQKNAPLRVIIGNPPYSIGQKSANDNAQNEKYDKLDSRVSETYVAGTEAANKNRVYDSYIRAFRWASDRLDKQNGGIIAFVTNAGWLDSSSMDGFRKCLEQEFSSIHVFNLRGNARTQGELRRKEAGNVFGGGSRTPIAVTLLVRNPKAKREKAHILYHDIGDYLSREEKLASIRQFGAVNNAAMAWTELHPNTYGDWINQRNNSYSLYISLEPEKKFDASTKSIFVVYSNGLLSSRDSWVYNSSRKALLENMGRMIDYYNKQVKQFILEKKQNPALIVGDIISSDSTKISWSSSLISQLEKHGYAEFEPEKVEIVLYRPYVKQRLYLGDKSIHRRGQMHEFFPITETKNRIICVSGIGGSKESSTIISSHIADLNCLDACMQCFPLYWYEENTNPQSDLFSAGGAEKYIRHDGVSDFILARAREVYGPKVTKEDIFYYVYGFLHCPTYRERYSADLKKMLPRLPLVASAEDFRAFSQAGRELAELHIGYETVKPYPLKEVCSGASLIVEQMRFPSKADKSRIIYNGTLTLEGIPLEAYEYVVNGKSAIEWVMERYAVTVHKESQIRNDPNDWCKEVGDPRYIVDLVKRVVRVSVETVRIVKALPAWEPEG